MIDYRYPIGKFAWKGAFTDDERRWAIEVIAHTPDQMRDAVEGLDDAQLDTPYREGGWTVRQVVHHVPDSHLNAYTRFKLALTEDAPTIKPYNEAAWAELPDSRGDISVSLDLLEALHKRWVPLLRTLSEVDYKRTFRHPEMGLMTLGALLRLYEWHGRHHVAHIMNLRSRMGWS
jgi:uncharacterized damage-inducible protein DinB